MFVVSITTNKLKRELPTTVAATLTAEAAAAANLIHNPILNPNSNLNNLTVSASVSKMFAVVTDTRIGKRQVSVHEFGIG